MEGVERGGSLGIPARRSRTVGLGAGLPVSGWVSSRAMTAPEANAARERIAEKEWGKCDGRWAN
jgi:hypothetical protein